MVFLSNSKSLMLCACEILQELREFYLSLAKKLAFGKRVF